MKIVIEINGDFWHANPKIYKSDWVNNINKFTAQEIWDKDNKHADKIKKAGYDVIFLWQKDFKENFDFVSIVEDYMLNRQIHNFLI